MLRASHARTRTCSLQLISGPFPRRVRGGQTSALLRKIAIAVCRAARTVPPPAGTNQLKVAMSTSAVTNHIAQPTALLPRDTSALYSSSDCPVLPTRYLPWAPSALDSDVCSVGDIRSCELGCDFARRHAQHTRIQALTSSTDPDSSAILTFKVRREALQELSYDSTSIFIEEDRQENHVLRKYSRFDLELAGIVE